MPLSIVYRSILAHTYLMHNTTHHLTSYNLKLQINHYTSSYRNILKWGKFQFQTLLQRISIPLANFIILCVYIQITNKNILYLWHFAKDKLIGLVHTQIIRLYFILLLRKVIITVAWCQVAFETYFTPDTPILFLSTFNYLYKD